MKEKKMDLKSSKLKEWTRKIKTKAQQKNLVKPISEAFKDIPTTDEVHKGKKEYF